MGDQRSMLEGSSSSMDGSCHWTEVSALNAQDALLNKQHLDFLPKYDRYLVSVGRKIGEGGQGCVYEGKIHMPYSFKPVPVAVKKFKPFEGVSPGHFPRVMGSVKSTNLCIPDGVFFEGDSLCMVMRRFSCDLRAAIDSCMKALQEEVLSINGSPFTKEVGEGIILQLAMGLQNLHECGVYHGDLKAANILVMMLGYGTSIPEPSCLAIADFERSESVMGTEFWRAPEVLQSLITERPVSNEQRLLADVYSFGMVCYEVMTGRIPFQGQKNFDYDLVLNGGRPELPNYVPEPIRDLIVRCWDANPHSRPNWSEIIKVLVPNDNVVHDDSMPNDNATIFSDGVTFDDVIGFDDTISYYNEDIEDGVAFDDASLLISGESMMNSLIKGESLSFESLIEDGVAFDDAPLLDSAESMMNSLVKGESLSFESLMQESKQVVRDLRMLYESDSKSFGIFYMPYYWASKYLTTVEEYASKFDIDSESPMFTWSFQLAFERTKLFLLLTHQMYGAKFDYWTFIDLLFKGNLDMVVHINKIIIQNERLQVMMVSIYLKVSQEFGRHKFSNEFENGTSWIGKLLCFHVLIKWVLWYEYADSGTRRALIGMCLEQTSVIQALLFFFCMMLNTYIYVLAMITYEPILLGLQYGLYKAKGCNNILYQSSGDRICRFQRAWMNCTRYNKLVSIIFSFSFVLLVTMYTWRGILGWILIPCVIICTPYWRQPIFLDR